MFSRADSTWEYRQCTPALSKIKEGKVFPGIVRAEREEDKGEPINNIQLTMSQSSGEVEVIYQLQASQAMKNLGLYTPSDGNTTPQFEYMRDRVDDWTVQMKNSKLPTRSVWLSYQSQLWAGMKYGLGASPASLDDLTERAS